MGIREIETLDDSSLVVQQIKGESQCLDGTMNKYRDRCLDLIKLLDMFHISGLYWPTMVQTAPTSMLHPIVRPWPF
jgi:hypothetical protein